MRFYLLLVKNILFSRKQRRFVNLFITLAAGSIAVGVSTLIIALSVLNGYEKLVTKKLLDLDAHIQIVGFGNKTFIHPEEIKNKISELVGSESVSLHTYVQGSGILKNRKKMDGITIEGIDPNAFIAKKGYRLLEGSTFNINSNQILIGKSLASKLFVHAGDTVKFFSVVNPQSADLHSVPIIETMVVSGVFESGFSKFDESYVFGDEHYLQKVFSIGNQVSGFEIKLSSLKGVDSLANVLQDNLRYPAYVKTIYQNYKAIFSWIELQRKPIPIVLALIILVAVFNIIATLLMMVIEKTEFIGVMRILGARQKQIVFLFLILGLTVGTLGIAAGNVLAQLLISIQLHYNIITLPSTVYFVSEVPLFYQTWIALLVSGVTFVVTLTVATLPSFIAAKIKAVSTLRFS